MNDFKQTAILGAGVIGASWAALFLASGKQVALYDIAPDAEKNVHDYIDKVWPSLLELGAVKNANQGNIRFCRTACEAVEGADFIQENIPERLNLKHALYAQIEPALTDNAIVATSASGLTLTEMQKGWQNPARFVLGHPFNPPHLIPLVEVMGNERTDADAVLGAHQFYQQIGKVTIQVNKEVPGHVANRLQAAVWREAIYLVKSGVASVEDVDKAMWAGPGLRWAVMGPTLLFHLGAGKGGLAEFCERYSDSFNRWWDDLGTLHLDNDIADKLVAGITQASNNCTTDELSAYRDALIVSIQKAMLPLRKAKEATLCRLIL